ncbi:MAG: DUF4416 family protein [Candidatus Aminicenantes bacterium]|nr:DUF4416 family protein [Candidatus Aminicenantes bacterium]
MSIPQPFPLVKPFCGMIFSQSFYRDQALKRMEAELSPSDHESESVPFHYTDYYAAEMGSSLFRCFVAFTDLMDPQFLPRFKHITLELEQQFSEKGKRKINLDPGYLSLSSMVIATAKNHCHRIPLSAGVYAHLEYVVRNGRLQPLEWTYPDFRSPEYMAFFNTLRMDLKKQLRRHAADGG